MESLIGPILASFATVICLFLMVSQQGGQTMMEGTGFEGLALGQDLPDSQDSFAELWGNV